MASKGTYLTIAAIGLGGGVAAWALSRPKPKTPPPPPPGGGTGPSYCSAPDIPLLVGTGPGTGGCPQNYSPDPLQPFCCKPGPGSTSSTGLPGPSGGLVSLCFVTSSGCVSAATFAAGSPVQITINALPNVALNNPQLATVFVDGQQVSQVPFSGQNIAYATIPAPSQGTHSVYISVLFADGTTGASPAQQFTVGVPVSTVPGSGTLSNPYPAPVPCPIPDVSMVNGGCPSGYQPSTSLTQCCSPIVPSGTCNPPCTAPRQCINGVCMIPPL
jgi:hypothetical protein